MPSASVVVVRVCPVPILVAVTVAFGTTAPEESFTVPVNAPVAAVWLNKGGAIIIEQTTRTIQFSPIVRLIQRVEISVAVDIDYAPPVRNFRFGPL